MYGDDPPISYDELRDLFAFLDQTSTTGYQCDHQYTLVKRFLQERNLPVEPMIEWLGHNGAGCDCEIMLNTAADWEERVGYDPPDEDADDWRPGQVKKPWWKFW